MIRTSAVVAVLGVASLLIATSAFSSSDAKTLKGTVGPGYTISLKMKGKKVKKLKAGSYSFHISDKSDFHNFTVEKEKGSHKFEKTLTGTSFTGSKTKTIKLTKGSYKFYCSIHEDLMHGFFKVT